MNASTICVNVADMEAETREWNYIRRVENTFLIGSCPQAIDHTYHTCMMLDL
jgi:hypothetical protein